MALDHRTAAKAFSRNATSVDTCRRTKGAAPFISTRIHFVAPWGDRSLFFLRRGMRRYTMLDASGRKICRRMRNVVMRGGDRDDEPKVIIDDGDKNTDDDVTELYARAEKMRIMGYIPQATEVYQKVLKDRRQNMDITAASRIACAESTPSRQDLACPLDEPRIVALRYLLLEKCGYTMTSIRSFFGIRKDLCPIGAIFVTPAKAGDGVLKGTRSTPREEMEDRDNMALWCVVRMFLLGYASSRKILLKYLGKDSVSLFEELGMAYPCELDPTLMVPYVTIFPLDCPLEDGTSAPLIFVTDWHPKVLLTTKVGKSSDGAVMYIGPDSLALVRHLLPLSLRSSSSGNGPRILDFCCGSGVQAICALISSLSSTSYGVCVDINNRALQFACFNAYLNGVGKKIAAVKHDLAMNDLEKISILNNFGAGKGFDLVMANPPFVPTPENMTEKGHGGGIDEVYNNISIAVSGRYGLFSSGGANGEEILRPIIEKAPRLLTNDCGILAIVSEFMNPGESLCRRIEGWWSFGTQPLDNMIHNVTSSGVLFTNELSLDAGEYSRRRAGGDIAQVAIWETHLSKVGISKVSPGLLYIRTALTPAVPKVVSANEVNVEHVVVPRMKGPSSGSLWTPHNNAAVEFTRSHQWWG